MGWKEAFGEEWDPGSSIRGLVLRGLAADESWHNDTCPTFRYDVPGREGEVYVVLWAEHPVRAQRELSSEQRYLLHCAITEDYAAVQPRWETNDEVVAATLFRALRAGLQGGLSDRELLGLSDLARQRTVAVWPELQPLTTAAVVWAKLLASWLPGVPDLEVERLFEARAAGDVAAKPSKELLTWAGTEPGWMAVLMLLEVPRLASTRPRKVRGQPDPDLPARASAALLEALVALVLALSPQLGGYEATRSALHEALASTSKTAREEALYYGVPEAVLRAVLEAARRDAELFHDEWPGEELDGSNTEWDSVAWGAAEDELREELPPPLWALAEEADEAAGESLLWGVYSQALYAEVTRLNREDRPRPRRA